MTIIAVPERGTAEVTSAEWSVISNDPRFWQLVSQNIIQAEAGAAGRWRLRGNCYVGRAIVGDIMLEVTEKFAGAFELLVGLGALKGPKLLKATSPISPSTGSTVILIALFLRSVRRYLSGWKVSSYIKVPDAGALIGGRLNIPRTIRLRTRGASHQAAFERTVLTDDLPFNRCIYAALRQVERIGSVISLPHSEIAAARVLRLGLSECLPGVLSARPGELSDVAFREAQRDHGRQELNDVITLAGAVLDAAGFGGADTWKRSVEHAWFVNLESFFEEAIRQTIRTALGGAATVTSAQNRPSLFRPATSRYRANPDVVISFVEPTTTAIADAKYKDFSTWPAPADIHELIAHASAYKATKALLFFPADGAFLVRPFGISTSGCQVWAYGISFQNFVGDVYSALSIAGLKADPM
ncbi:hypothetical protein [Mesorhizobium sp.]|uniref:5-methylcytosine restriction system specificity protein McrC n=1 Tax=Mesorhizobium sp. TaxID=1871066 RepID=UPI0025DA4D81|nr:hypothetical protein [Mesorhizobium sp.]